MLDYEMENNDAGVLRHSATNEKKKRKEFKKWERGGTDSQVGCEGAMVPTIQPMKETNRKKMKGRFGLGVRDGTPVQPIK